MRNRGTTNRVEFYLATCTVFNEYGGSKFRTIGRVMFISTIVIIINNNQRFFFLKKKNGEIKKDKVAWFVFQSSKLAQDIVTRTVKRATYAHYIILMFDWSWILDLVRTCRSVRL